MAYEPLDTNDRTIVKPTPGGRPAAPRAAPMAQPLPMPAQVIDFDVALLANASVNQIVGAAAPLINLARQLRGSAAQGDVDTLRARAVEEVKAFERRILAAGVPPEQARAAHYALCATVDDIVLNTPWGAYSSWASHSLVSTFHVDITGGERFFDLLTHLHKDPGTNRDVLALMYLCLSIGFEGRLRVLPEGQLELSRLREGLYNTLRQVYGDFERELSPHWRGVDARHRPMRSFMALWTIIATTVALLIGAYFAFTWFLNDSSDHTLQALAGAPPHGPASIGVQAPAPLPVVEPKVVDKVSAALDGEIKQNLVSVETQGTSLVVRIHNAGMFASGSANLDEKFVPLINRVAASLADQRGTIIVAGHTDNVRMHSLRFKSNYELSQARAQAVSDILAGTIPGNRLKVEGRADTEPVASNETQGGRDSNRRTDIIVAEVATTAPVTGQPAIPIAATTSAGPPRSTP